MKKTSGFTLVELIVVIAILAILAGIAIPVYSGYIDKAQQAADMQALDSLKTAAVFAAVSKDPNAKVTQIAVTGGSKTASPTVSITTDSTKAGTLSFDDIKEYVGDPLTFKYVASTTWTPDGGWTTPVKQS